VAYISAVLVRKMRFAFPSAAMPIGTATKQPMLMHLSHRSELTPCSHFSRTSWNHQKLAPSHFCISTQHNTRTHTLWLFSTPSNITPATDVNCIGTPSPCRYQQLVDAHASVYSRAADYWHRRAVEVQQQQAREDVANQGMTVQFKSAAVELEKSLAERHALREAGDDAYRQHGHVGKII